MGLGEDMDFQYANEIFILLLLAIKTSTKENLRTKNSSKTFKSISRRIKVVIGICSKNEKNKRQDEIVTMVELIDGYKRNDTRSLFPLDSDSPTN
jgi:hypothetical protein